VVALPRLFRGNGYAVVRDLPSPSRFDQVCGEVGHVLAYFNHQFDCIDEHPPLPQLLPQGLQEVQQGCVVVHPILLFRIEEYLAAVDLGSLETHGSRVEELEQLFGEQIALHDLVLFQETGVYAVGGDDLRALGRELIGQGLQSGRRVQEETGKQSALGDDQRSG